MIAAPLPLPSSTAPRLVACADLLAVLAADYEEAWEARQAGQSRGPVTGFRGLDAELGGHLAVGVHAMHGSPGAGKTAWALQIAATCGSPSLFVSVEMGAEELFRRLTARVTGTYLGKLRGAELPPAEALALFRRTAAACPDLVIADATTSPATPEWLTTSLMVVRRTSAHALVVVDSVHSWASSLTTAELGEYESLNCAMADLRALAEERRAAVLITVERNRASMQSGGQHAGAGTRRLDYAPASVLELTREADALPDASGEVAVTLKISKNRNGCAGRTYGLRFHGALQRFTPAP